MKHKIENKYIYWGLTALCVIAFAILFYFIVLRIDNIKSIITSIFSIFRPLLYGIVIAFLLTQSYNFFDRKFTKLLRKKIKDEEKIKKFSKTLSIIISILIMLIILFCVLYLLIPKLILSILGIIEILPDSIIKAEAWLENILKVNSNLEKMILSLVNDSSQSLISWIKNGVLPQMETIFESVTTGLNGMYTFLKDFIIGIVFSIYILINKTRFISQLKKFMYSILDIKKGNTLLQGARYSYKIFNGFIKGKLITSLIIGVACYISMIIFNLPYALLISLIIAITNIIPFFGPIIGWIPGVIILLLINPMQALYFTIINIVLQQIEGNIVEPKIIGNSIGLSGFWVLFSILIFGGMFGFLGMIIGVPIFAIFYHFASFYLKKYLMKKGLPYDTKDYDNLKYIDETTKKVVKKKSSNS